jgi:ankyrin repeat protein
MYSSFNTLNELVLNTSKQQFEDIVKANPSFLEARDGHGQNLLHIALNGGNITYAGFLIQQGINVHAIDGAGMQAIHYAAKSGVLSALEALLAKNVDINTPNSCGYTAAHFAAMNYDSKMLDSVIHKGANLDAQTISGLVNNDSSMTPIDAAVKYGSKANIELLWAAGSAHPNFETLESYQREEKVGQFCDVMQTIHDNLISEHEVVCVGETA